MGSRLPITWRRSMASPMSRSSRKAGSAPAMSVVTRRSSVQIICCPGNNPFYEFSMKLWEGLEQELNYNAMVSQRGVLNLFHSDGQRDAYARRGNAMRLLGVDAELLDQAPCAYVCRFWILMTPAFRFWAALLQSRGGTARHDAVAWGMRARADSGRRYHPELRGHRVSARGGHIRGVETTRGVIRAKKVGLAVAGNTSHVAGWPACGCQSKAMCCKLSSRKASSLSYRPWSPSVQDISI